MKTKKSTTTVNTINAYEQEQKGKLVTLGQSTKAYGDVLRYLENEIDKSKKMANFRHKIKCFRNDGVYQLNRAIEEIYGVSAAKSESRPSAGDQPIETIDVTLSNGVRKKVPYGKIELPDMGEDAYIDIAYNRGDNSLYVKGSTQFRFSSVIDSIIDRTRELLNTESVYKSLAIEINSDFEPKVMNLKGIDKEFMILSEKTEYELQPLKSRILHPEKCIANGIPLKTGVLLEGRYGTGKTLLAFKLAKDAIERGWVFIYLKDPKLLAETLRLSQTLDKNGNGVILFLEDVDQVTRGDRDASMQDILNTLDGGDTKNMNVISLFTTNHIELIEPTFLRGKRIGSVVSMGFLDAGTARKFIEYAFKGHNLEVEGLDAVCEEIEKEKIVPAFMAEIVEKVKSNMVFAESDVVKVSYIQNSLESYLRQVKLANKKDMTRTPEMDLAEALRVVLQVPEVSTKLAEIKSEL